VLDWLAATDEPVVNLDKLTYAGNRENLPRSTATRATSSCKGDICDRALVDRLLAEHRPRAIVHFAAESHVDRSIHGPGEFIQTNMVGTFTLLEEARGLLEQLEGAEGGLPLPARLTDEVYGSLSRHDPPFTETTPYEPNSPYSASKAASDHLVRAWHHTYGCRCSPPTARTTTGRTTSRKSSSR
jgi:dTDP-glucose 4,6-dehydratase